MIKRVVKLGIAVVFCVVHRLCCAGMFLIRKTPKGRLEVLLYHAVTVEQRDRFAKQVAWLAKNTVPLSLAQFAQLQPGKQHSSVTFDDGFTCVVDNALPELAKWNIPSVIFIPTAWMGKEEGWAMEGQLCLDSHDVFSSEVLETLDRNLVQFGSHCRQHLNLTKISMKDAEREIVDSKKELESMSAVVVEHLAFPYGAYTQAHVDLAMEAGYKKVHAAIPFGINGNIIGRVDVSPDDWFLEFTMKAQGYYQWMPLAIKMKRCVKSLLGMS